MILQLVTDRRRLAPAEASWAEQRACLLRQIQNAADAGIDFVQIRERDLEAGVLCALVSDAVAVVNGARTRVLVNDRIDVALAAGAHGAHLRGDSLPPDVARRLAPPPFILGRSTHSVDEAARCSRHVDYLLAGTVWSTSSKAAGGVLLGPEALAEVVLAAAGTPVLAIGGVTLERIDEVAAARASGVAAISLFISDAASSDTSSRCGAKPLHDVARGLTGRYMAAASRL